MSAIETLLSRLDGVRQSRVNSWMARCPAHNGDGRSMAVTHAEDGRILIHCFAHECDVSDILAAIGMTVSELFPDRLPEHRYRPRKHAVSSLEVLRAMRHEMLVVSFLAESFAEGVTDESLCRRAQLAAGRIQTALSLCDG